MKVITKSELGRIMVKYVGNEGNTNSPEDEKLRQMFQACIDFVPRREDKVWFDAGLNIFDKRYNVIKIISGDGKHDYVCQLNSSKEPNIYPFTKEYQCKLM